MAALLPILMMEEGKANMEINPTNLTNIFMPIGSVVPKTDWAILQFNLNITQLFAETNQLCEIVQIIPKFVKKAI